MKHLILSLLIIVSSFVPSTKSHGESNLYFIFDSPKQIELKESNAKSVADNLLLEDEDGYTYDAIVNVINDKKIAISPIKQIDSKLRIKGVTNYKISNYTANIYIQNKKNLNKIAKELESNYDKPLLYDTRDTMVAEPESALQKSADTKTSSSNDYSKTNTQTKGIDEADIIKTDGKNIYYIKENDLLIIDADPKNPSIKATIYSNKDSISNKNLKKLLSYQNNKVLNNIYVDNNKLSLIYSSDELRKNSTYETVTIVDTYDVSNPANPKLISSKTLKGYLVESRKKGNVIYFTTTDSFSVIYKESVSLPFIQNYPKARYEYDASDADLAKMLYTAFNPSMTITKISSVNVANNTSAENMSYMGSSENIYMSTNNLYISSPSYKYNPKKYYFEDSTTIKKFDIDNFKYIGSSEIQGEIVNQFSLNELNNNLFVAYTKDKFSENSENNLISFDKNMKKISELSGLAKGEKIYSVRFVKDKAHIVTFKQVDPLFVIDIKNPKSMQVLGYLKIPGYSNYLHPYKDNYLIGFGQNTMTKENNVVVNNGFKISLFDLNDFNNPKEVDTQNIGTRGSYSLIEYNHKALMFDDTRDIFSIPVYVTKSEKSSSNDESFYNITPTFMGAYVYNISEKGFDLKGRITHYNNKEQNNAKYDVYEYDKQIQRIIQIKDNIYTVSNYGIKINNINTLKEISELKF